MTSHTVGVPTTSGTTAMPGAPPSNAKTSHPMHPYGHHSYYGAAPPYHFGTMPAYPYGGFPPGMYSNAYRGMPNQIGSPSRPDSIQQGSAPEPNVGSYTPFHIDIPGRVNPDTGSPIGSPVKRKKTASVSTSGSCSPSESNYGGSNDGAYIKASPSKVERQNDLAAVAESIKDTIKSAITKVESQNGSANIAQLITALHDAGHYDPQIKRFAEDNIPKLFPLLKSELKQVISKAKEEKGAEIGKKAKEVGKASETRLQGDKPIKQELVDDLSTDPITRKMYEAIALDDDEDE